MFVGYARTSTFDQRYGLEAQIVQLRELGCEEVFQEQVSSVDRVARVELGRALSFIRKGDVLVVTKLDRLARSISHLLEIVDALEEKGASLKIIDMDVDTRTATGRLMLTLLGAIAQWELSNARERQAEGIARAKAEGKYRGRVPTAMRRAEEVSELLAAGVGATDVAKRLGMSRASVYRVARSLSEA